MKNTNIDEGLRCECTSCIRRIVTERVEEICTGRGSKELSDEARGLIIKLIAWSEAEVESIVTLVTFAFLMSAYMHEAWDEADVKDIVTVIALDHLQSVLKHKQDGV